jgi:phenylalanyl-tRNA synthetase beta chain
MICSAAELGLGTEHAGILVLPPGTAEPGADAIAVLGLDDVVFDVAITPDRGYCLSVRGLAREIACAYDLNFVDPADVAPLPAEGEAWPLTIQPGTGVSRFALRPVLGIDQHAKSPWWLRRRLMLCGIRPISPAVDVTNYVMIELGHPLHAHDRSRINGAFDVRFAKPGETVVTLDDVTRRLDPGDVLIVDDVPTAPIGVFMGAGTTEIDNDSTDVLLEAAVWDPATVSRTQRRLHLVSEASRRYERSVDPAVSVTAVNRAATLLAEIAGGAVQSTLTDWRGDPPRDDWSHPPVRMDFDLPDRIAGVEYGDGVTFRRLTQIGTRVVEDDVDPRVLVVTPPSWRPDLVQPADLVEEVLRLEGLDMIPSVLPAAPAGRGLTPKQQRRRAIGKSLALSGYVEILPTPFLPAGVFDTWGLEPEDPRRTTTVLLNPLEADRPHLATTLLPGLLEALARNVSRGAVDTALFGIAQVVEPTSRTRAVELIPTDRRPTDDEIATLDASLPHQPQHVGVVLTGLREPRGPWGPGRPVEASDAFEAVRVIARASGVEVTLRPAQHLPWHPGRCAEVFVGSGANAVSVGYAGQLHPAVIERSGLPKGTCAAELDLDAIPVTESLPAPKVSPFPAVFQDVSLIVDAVVSAQAVVDAVRDGAGPLLEAVQLFDVYTGPQVGADRKSVTLALRFRAADRTLTEDEASAARDAAVAAAAAAVGAIQRA